MKQGLELLVTQFFYLSIVGVIQNERKANFVTLYDLNLVSKQARYGYTVGSISDSSINVKKCVRCNKQVAVSEHHEEHALQYSRPRLLTAVKSKPFLIHGSGLFSPISKHQEKSLC